MTRDCREEEALADDSYHSPRNETTTTGEVIIQGLRQFIQGLREFLREFILDKLFL
jgi:hypothetical protein